MQDVIGNFQTAQISAIDKENDNNNYNTYSVYTHSILKIERAINNAS